MKNAGKACNNRLYRHIRTFEKIVKNYFVIYREKSIIKASEKEYEKAGKTAEKQKGEEKICSYFIPRSMLVSAM